MIDQSSRSKSDDEVSRRSQDDQSFRLERSLNASLTDDVTARIRLGILRGDLGSGQPLIERELARKLSVSKTPVREALKILSRTGLVVTTPYRGVVVREVDAEMVRNVYAVRALLEPHAARLAVPHHDKRSIEALRVLLKDASNLADAGQIVELGVMNRRFHRLLYERCGNPRLCALLDDLQDELVLIAISGWRLHATWERELAEHLAIVDAVARGHAAKVEKLLLSHMTESKMIQDESRSPTDGRQAAETVAARTTSV